MLRDGADGFMATLALSRQLLISPRVGGGRRLASNSAMPDTHELTARLIELEIKASFAEDLVDHLNQIVIRQQQQIDLLVREVAELRRQAPEPGSAPFRSLRDELPPHY